VRVERFDPRADERRLRFCHEMTVAGQPQDDPNVPAMVFSAFRGWWGYGFGNSPQQAWLATDESGEPTGGYLLELPEKENRQNAFGFVVVPPARRRRGAGTELLAHMARESGRAGRKLLLSSTRVGAPADAFAIATGGSAGLRDIRRILPVDAGLRERLPGLRASAAPRAAGYTLRSWLGAAPDDLVDGICATYTALEDAPHDEAFEPTTWDRERLRKSEERVVAQGTRQYSIAAVAAGTGEVAAVTQAAVDPLRPEWCWQEVTAVIRRHRGHRLGLLVKVAMLEMLAEHEPQLRNVATFNAELNDRMIAVNEQLGYRVSDYFQFWEHDVAAAGALARGL
jgi:GNAT superfamily N-acetyltransferase/RimJ/RimL family protein N-acetyltransferase